MKEIKFLHISDLHYGKDSLNLNEATKEFFQDLKNISVTNEIDFVIFSGDLVQNGNEKNFKEVKNVFIDPLLNLLNLSINEFFFVPGNHETNREKIGEYEKKLKPTMTKEEITKLIKNKIKEDIFFKKLEDFNEFKSSLKQNSVENNIIYSTHKLVKYNRSIGISCLNTTLFCKKDDTEKDEGNLILSEHQILEASNSIEECDLKIAVCHHGLECLKDDEKYSSEAQIYKKYDLLLTGHFHKERIEESYLNGRSAIKSVAGSLYSGKNRFNGYSIITIFEKEIKIEFRAYYPERLEYDKGINIIKDGEFKATLKGKDNFDKKEINYQMYSWTEKKASKKLLSNCTSCEAPKKIEDIFVEPTFSLKSSDKEMMEQSGIVEKGKEEEEKVFLKDIFENKKNYFFIGEKESGKTTLINYMMLKIIKENMDDKIIPIYLLGEIFIKKRNLANEILKYLISAGAKNISYKDVEELIAQGRFIIFIDDYDLEVREQTKWLGETITSYKKNRFLVFIKDNYGIVDLKNRDKINEIDCEKTLLYTKQFNKKQIKELSKKWIMKDEIDNKEIEKLIRNVNRIGISKTPHILSLMLLVSEQRTNFIPENKALLLDVFFDIILEKMNLDTMFKSVNYTTKINYLSNLAREMKKNKKKELLRGEVESITLTYLEDLNLHIGKVSEFIDQFIKRGIFYESEKKISFKYQSFYEFFIAKQMTESDEFRNEIFEEENYICSPEEIEYYSGLKCENSYSVDKIFQYLKLMNKKLLIKDEIDKYEFNIDNPRITQQTFGDEIKVENSNQGFYEDELEENEIKPRYSKECSERCTKDITEEEKYTITLTLLSNIFRNCYLVKNKELRENVFGELIATYSNLLVEIDKKFKNKILEKKEVQDSFRLFICVLFSEFLTENLSSEKIKLFIKDKMKKENNKIEKFILNILYLNNFYDDSLKIILNYIDQENNYLFLDIVQFRVMKYFVLKKCSPEETDEIKFILRKIYLKKSEENKKDSLKIVSKKIKQSEASEKVNKIINTINKNIEDDI